MNKQYNKLVVITVMLFSGSVCAASIYDLPENTTASLFGLTAAKVRHPLFSEMAASSSSSHHWRKSRGHKRWFTAPAAPGTGSGIGSGSGNPFPWEEIIEPIDFNESPDTGVDPVHISVSAVPVPAAVWLFGSGLLGIIAIARGKRRQC